MNVLSQTAKVIFSPILSVTAIVLFLQQRCHTRRQCMIAMLLCTAGDFFMTDIFRLGAVSVYVGAAFFIAAHIVYALCFIHAAKIKSYEYNNTGFRAGVILTVAAAAALAVITALADKPQWFMFGLIMVYLAVIGWNLSSQFSFAYSDKGQRYFLFSGMGLFLISDFTVFLPMLTLCREYNDFVLATYIPAQLLSIFLRNNGYCECPHRAGKERLSGVA